jgi:hypothetical protein
MATSALFSLIQQNLLEGIGFNSCPGATNISPKSRITNLSVNENEVRDKEASEVSDVSIPLNDLT